MMRFLFGLSCVLVWTMLSAAPSPAAIAYSWPVVVTQPVTISNASVPNGASVIVSCKFEIPNKLNLLALGSATVPVTKNQDGSFSYSGQVNVPMNPTYGGAALPPGTVVSSKALSGASVMCQLVVSAGGQQTNLGPTVYKNLP